MTKKTLPVGLFLHTFEEDGSVNYQGRIIGVEGDSMLVQLFSWIDGRPTNVVPMERSFIYSPSCRLYATNADMLAAYESGGAR